MDEDEIIKRMKALKEAIDSDQHSVYQSLGDVFAEHLWECLNGPSRDSAVVRLRRVEGESEKS